MIDDNTMAKNYTHWTTSMEKFLIENYSSIGDTQLAQMFEKKFPKSFTWTKKHIEKKRYYMKLKRTAEQENRLRVLNNRDGRQVKTWDSRGRMKDGDVREWNGRKYIKFNGRTILYSRYSVNAKPGEIVRTHEGGFKIIDRRQNQRINADIRKNRPSELKQTIKALNQLKKICQGK